VTDDDRLRSVLSVPFTSPEDAAERLSWLLRYFTRNDDGRSVFLAVYTRMTTRVREGIATGHFHNPEWVSTYLTTFADYYRQAISAWEFGDRSDVPPPWRVAFIAAEHNHTTPLQDALLGINAHINYDLAYALAEVGIDPSRSEKREDHRRVNAILKDLVDVVQDVLSDDYDAPISRHLDRWLGSVDERAALWSLRETREVAWRRAVSLTDAQSSLRRSVVRVRLTALSMGAAAVLLAHGVCRQQFELSP
jgi:hypothetical protein